MVGPVSTPFQQSDEFGLREENEQLRTALESALEENTSLIDDRDRLLHRITTLSRHLQEAHSIYARDQVTGPVPAAVERRSEVEEELRVAFEELQVLTEELEVANDSLIRSNRDLDERVEQRTQELMNANAALRAAEASMRAMANLVPDLLWRAEAGGAAAWFNQRWFDYTGQAVSEAMGHGWIEAIHPADRGRIQAAWADALASGEPYHNETRIRSATADFRWFIVRAQPLRDERGRIIHWFGASTDVHEQRVMLDALQQSELRFRTLVEGMPPLAWRAADGGKWTWASPQWLAYTGQKEADALADGWLDAFHPDDHDAARKAWAQAQDSGRLEIEGRIFHAEEQRYRHFRTRALPVRCDSGLVAEWLGTSTDVDDIVRLQGEQQVLVAELQHRTRNLIGVVRQVALKTARSSDDLPDFRERFRERLDSLARVQGLLSRLNEHDRVLFDELILSELSAHGVDPDGEPRIALEGPVGVRLRSTTVQTLAMALHELATNAVKYGAIGQQEARLRIRWHVTNDDGQPFLHIDWHETGVAMPPPSTSLPGSGQGRELIERALPYQLSARTTYSLGNDGVHCTIIVPISATSPAKEDDDDG